MRFPPTNHPEKLTQPTMCEGRANFALSPSRDLHSSIECRTVRQSSRSPSITNDQPLSPEEYIYTETVKSIGNNEFIEEKRLLKRASWSPAALHEHGLPPSGKRQEIELTSASRNSNRVRLRPKTGRHYQSQETNPAHARPVSYSERYNRRIFDYQQQQQQQQQLISNRHQSFTRSPIPSPSLSSIDMTTPMSNSSTRASPSFDNSDFISDTSIASSITSSQANTLTSLSSGIIPSNRFSRSSNRKVEHVLSSTNKPTLLSEYQHANSTPLDYKCLTPVSQINTIHRSSPISSSPSSSFSSISTTTSFTCPKGHEQLSTSSSTSSPLSSSPMRSSRNQYAQFTCQTTTADTSRDNISPSTTTTRSLMTMSMSPNRHHNQTRSAKAIITSAQISPITTNNIDGLNSSHKPEDQTESPISPVIAGSCLKSPTTNQSRAKKSVHFDWHLSSPEDKRSTSVCQMVKPTRTATASHSNYRSGRSSIASSSSSSSSSSLFNDEQKKGDDDVDDDEWRDVVETRRRDEDEDEERERRIETEKRTSMINTNPLTSTSTNNPSSSPILRSFSLSSSFSASRASEEKNNDDSRRSTRREEEEGEGEGEREGEKRENVDNDDSNSTPTSRRVTTAVAAATHLHCTAASTSATVTFNDATSANVSNKNESTCHTIFLKRPSSSSSSSSSTTSSPLTANKAMPSNHILVKTSSLSTISSNPPMSSSSSTSSSTASAAKKLLSQGLFSLIGRSNSNHNKSTSPNEENKQLRRTSSSQFRPQLRKAKQQITNETNGNARLSTSDVESLFPRSSTTTNIDDQRSQSDKVNRIRERERQSSCNSLLYSSTSNEKFRNPSKASNLDLSSTLCNNATHLNDMTTIRKSAEDDSLKNGLLFQPAIDPKCDYILHEHQNKSTDERFFLSLTNQDEPASTMMQTSTLIISTPPQYHYYLYPPINNTNTLSSSSSSSGSSSISSSTSKKVPKIISTNNRAISNVSINSVSTNSSSSYPSCESQVHDQDYHPSSQTPIHAEDETISSSTSNSIRPKKVVQSALIDWNSKGISTSNINENKTTITPPHAPSTDSSTRTKPVILSDSVQAFWPPPPSQSTFEQKSTTNQSESISISTQLPSSTTTNSIRTVPPANDEMGSYSEQHTFSSTCRRNAGEETNVENSQASYTERLREKSRLIPMNGHTSSSSSNEMNSYLKRSNSKDTLNDSQVVRGQNHLHWIDYPPTHHHESTSRVKFITTHSNGTNHIPVQIEQNDHQDFQSKREFFEHRTSSTTISPSNSMMIKPKVYTLYPSSSPVLISPNNVGNQGLLQVTPHASQPVIRRSWNDLISQVPSTSTTSSSSETSPNQIQRKPMRIVKAVQRSPPSINENRPLTGPKTYSLAKPGLFSASPLNSIQKQQINSKSSTTNFSPREETDVQSHLKEFASRYPNHHQFKELARLTRTNEHRLSSDYTRCLFPIVDRSKRRNFQENSDENKHLSMKTSTHPTIECHITRTVSNETNIFDDQSLRQADELRNHLKKRFDALKENQRLINEEIEENQRLGSKLLNFLESQAEANEMEKLKLHINEIDTITSILLKLSSRLAKIENDILMISSESSESTKTNLIERRDQAKQKHDEAKALKDGIDRRSRVVTTILRKYFTDEQFDEFEHFIRMKSTLLMDIKDIEEHLALIEQQIHLLNQISSNFLSSVQNNENRFSSSIGDFQSLNCSTSATNSFKTISTTA